MKNMLKTLVYCGVLAALMLAGCSGDSSGEKTHVTKPLLSVLDSANMMLVTPVGLGDRAKGKVISGRLYENFVQMIRLADADESLLDTFSTECATGLRVQLFKDTLSVAELRIAEKIGRIGGDIGTWTPKSAVVMARMITFFRGQGINFRPCSVVTADQSENGEDALAQLVLSSDTAVGKPLYEIVKDADRATVGFTRFITNKSDLGKPRKNKMELDSSQLQELISLLREPKKESFAGGCLCLSKANVTFYRDSSVIMSVKVIGNDFRQLEKHPLDLESDGMWVSAHPEKIKAFFDRLDSNKKPEPPASTAEP
ncbi:MAG: hypothetical protein IK012_01610 [Fibrobacter sp.]|uniref:hypothetical protein n=1 Tax=Fibrobacter sp. TaxID=35828 RepID=UPI0025BC8CC8|nr:hypothetical protein [Fibrobacter sp.]MBR4783936.1 hypothetical protein [Fibrobacter sp.]